MRDEATWRRILAAVGVKTVNINLWAPLFAETITDSTFSQGDEDLKDFLPTVLHESGYLSRIRESGFYSADRIRELGMRSAAGTRWRSLVPIADSIARNEAKFFEACYGGRLGNDIPGDGAKYPGRGLVMVTGKANYKKLADKTAMPLVEQPELLEEPRFALEISIRWWEGDVPDEVLGDVKRVRYAVNGGNIGLEEVRVLTDICRRVIEANP